MISQFNQPRGSTSIEVNKQSIARNFGVKENEVVYFTVGIDLGGFKVIYDESTQRAYSLPSGIVSGTTAISLNEQAILVHSAGTVDLGELANSRGEFYFLPGSFETGATLNTRNDVLLHSDTGYAYLGTLPVTVAPGTNPENDSNWVIVSDNSLRQKLSSDMGYAFIGELGSVVDFVGLVGIHNTRVRLKSWHNAYLSSNSGRPSGGGEFIYRTDVPKNKHNGGTVISPTVPYTTISAYLLGSGETDPTGTGCWVRDYNDSVNITWFGAIADGVTDNSASLKSFRDCIAAQTGKRRGYIPSGTYAYYAFPNFAIKGMHLYGDGKNNTVLKSLSGERAFEIDGSKYGNQAVFDVVIENIGIEGHAGTQHIAYVENTSHITMRNINLREASPTTGTAMSLLWTVASVFENITCSINEQPMTNKPYYGIVLGTSPSRNLKSTANLFINTIMEGVVGTGIRLNDTDLNTFIGGTSEANGKYGITTAGGSRQNKFVGMGFEANGTADLLDGGQDTVLENCYTGKSIVLLSSSRRARIVGGLHERIEMQSGCSAANIENLTINYFDTGSGGIYNSGTNSSFRNVFDFDLNTYIYPKKPRTSISVGTSPFTYTNESGGLENVLIVGGTVTQVLFKRESDQTVTGQTQGIILLAPGDQLVVSHAGAPTMSRIPMGNNNV